VCKVAQTIAHTSATELAGLCHRIAQRRGEGRATLAVARAVLVILCHMLHDHNSYHDLCANYSDRLDTERLQHRYIRRLALLGYTVTLAPAPVP
jgi:hypothetical protein